MWGEVDCESCGGTGDEPGPPGYWMTGSSIEPALSRLEPRLEVSAQMDGEFYSGRFPCGDCNGSGKQVVWYDTCRQCKGRGTVENEAKCARCNGLGFYEPEPSSKVSRWEEVTEF